MRRERERSSKSSNVGEVDDVVVFHRPLSIGPVVIIGQAQRHTRRESPFFVQFRGMLGYTPGRSSDACGLQAKSDLSSRHARPVSQLDWCLLLRSGATSGIGELTRENRRANRQPENQSDAEARRSLCYLERTPSKIPSIFLG